MPNILIELEIDYEELIKQYKWLTDVHEELEAAAAWRGANGNVHPPELEGLETMLEFMIEDVFGSTHIYRKPNGQEYLVILSEDSVLHTFVSYWAGAASKIDRDSFTWVKTESGMVPVHNGVTTKEVSILEVEPELRIMIRQCISDGGMLESDQK